MRLKSLLLKNFRCYTDEITVSFSELTAFIGRNDVGKSSILDALNIFFDETKLDASDICVHAERDTEVRIGCIFDKLPDGVVLDKSAETSLREEYLLNADGDLEVHKIYKSGTKSPKETVVAVAYHPSAENVQDLLLLKNSDLKERASILEVDTKEVDLRSNVSLRKAMWSNCDDLMLQRQEVPLDSEDAKRIWERLGTELPVFALFKSDRPSTDEDSEVQDPLKLAIKEALAEVSEELETIKRQVRDMAIDTAARTLEKLRSIDPTLANELKPEFKTEPKWESLFKLSLKSDDDIPINKRGSGTRRLILLSFFRAEADRRREVNAKSSIIYAIEEPETSQHPQNQKMLIESLKELSLDENVQVVITTHVPGIAGLLPIDSARYLHKDENDCRIVEQPTDQTLENVVNDLGVLSDRRVKLLVCVEGKHDVTCLCHLMRLASASCNLPDIESDPRVAVMPLGGNTLRDWVEKKYLSGLGLPEVHIYDRGDKSPPEYQEAVDKVNNRADNSIAFLTENP